tara:strand:+ start:44090 stop:44881 length:792 start_codon:yes stop_codon:yes gene_type:complete
MSKVGRLVDKKTIITGGGRGIGQAIALRFAQEGAQVVVADINLESAELTASLIREKGGKAIALSVNLIMVKNIKTMIEKSVSFLGSLDILINNAGRVEIKPFLAVDEQGWDNIIDLNLKGTYFCMQAGAHQMIKQGSGGRIINMSSISGRHGRADSSVYAASKMAVISITQSGALALAEQGILVNALCPGVVATPMWDTIDEDRARLFGYKSGTARANLVEKIPLKRVAQTEEIAAAAVFLASDENTLITGQAINVDGGMEMN